VIYYDLYYVQLIMCVDIGELNKQPPDQKERETSQAKFYCDLKIQYNHMCVYMCESELSQFHFVCHQELSKLLLYLLCIYPGGFVLSIVSL